MDEYDHERAESRVHERNANRMRRACQGEPGNPPELICEVCGFEYCECEEETNDEPDPFPVTQEESYRKSWDEHQRLHRR